MEIQLESTEPHTIRSYTDQSIVVGETSLLESCIISQQAIQTHWPIQRLDDLKQEHLDALLHYRPEVIILGHAGRIRPMPEIASQLSQVRIGLECMAIGSACRTFNVLLSEQRAVVLAIILNTTHVSPGVKNDGE